MNHWMNRVLWPVGNFKTERDKNTCIVNIVSSMTEECRESNAHPWNLVIQKVVEIRQCLYNSTVYSTNQPVKWETVEGQLDNITVFCHLSTTFNMIKF